MVNIIKLETFNIWKLFQKWSKLDVLFLDILSKWKSFECCWKISYFDSIVHSTLKCPKWSFLPIRLTKTYWNKINITMEKIFKLENFLLSIELCVHNQMYVWTMETRTCSIVHTFFFCNKKRQIKQTNQNRRVKSQILV